MAGTPTVGDVQRWAAELDRVAGRIGPRFARAEVRGRAVEFLRGLVSAVERKNGWQLVACCLPPRAATISPVAAT